MTLGQGHIGVNVGLEDCDSVSGYGFMEKPVEQDSDDAGGWNVQGRGNKKVYVPVNTPSVISTSVKVATGGVFAEYEAFAKKLRKGK